MIKLHNIVGFMYSPPGTNRYVIGWGRYKAFSKSQFYNDIISRRIVEGLGNTYYIEVLTR